MMGMRGVQAERGPAQFGLDHQSVAHAGTWLRGHFWYHTVHAHGAHNPHMCCVYGTECSLVGALFAPESRGIGHGRAWSTLCTAPFACDMDMPLKVGKLVNWGLRAS